MSNNSKHPQSDEEGAKVYTLKLDSEARMLASKARRESVPARMPQKGVSMSAEVGRAADSLESAVSDQTEAVYLVVSKLDSTSQRQETILMQQSKLQCKVNLIATLMIIALAIMLLFLVSLATQLPSFFRSGL